MIRRLTATATALAVLSLASLSSAPSAIAAEPPYASDITSTSEGLAAAEEAAARHTELGVATEAGELLVLKLENGDLLIAPRNSVGLAATTKARPEGGRGVTSVLTPDQPDDDANSDLQQSPELRGAEADSAVAVAAAPYWSLWASACFTRTQNTQGWMDTCYHIHKLINDGNGSYDWFELHMFATGASKCCYKFKDMTVTSARSGGSTQTWHAWSPGSDSNRSCGNVTVGVTVNGVGISYGHQHCETWDITKYAAAGQFANTWRGALFAEPVLSEREVAFDIAVRVPQGGYARWSLNWWFNIV